MMRYSPPSAAAESKGERTARRRREKEAGSSEPHLAHKRPQCGRFSGSCWGVTGGENLDHGGSRNPEIPSFTGNIEGLLALNRREMEVIPMNKTKYPLWIILDASQSVDEKYKADGDQ